MLNLIKGSKKESKILLLLEKAHTLRINNLSQSIILAQDALNNSILVNNKSLQAKSYSQLALYNMVIGEMEKATFFSNEAIRIFTDLNDKKGIADAKYSLAGVYYKTNLYHLGFITFIDALKIYKRNDDYYNQSRTEKSLGTIYDYIGDYISALRLYNSAVKNAKKVCDFNLESNAYNAISGILVKKGKLKFAMAFINKSIQLKEKTNDVRGMAYALYGKGKVYFWLNEYENAESFYFKALSIHNEMGEKTGLAMTYTKLGELYYKMGKLALALENAFVGLKIANELNLVMCSIKLNKLVSLIYKSKKEYSLSLEFLERYQKEKDLVMNAQTFKVIENYGMMSRIEVLKNEVKLQKEKEEILEQKNNIEIQEVKMRQEFLSIMSHEIRTPLNAITSIITLLKDEMSEEGEVLLQSLQFASSNLIKIVNDVLDFTKLDSQRSKLEKTPVNLFDLAQKVVGVYEKQAQDKGLQLILHFDIKERGLYYLDETKIVQILNNLISNAIKFTNEGAIELSIKLLKIKKKHDKIIFEVKDTGEGISKNNLKDIFESFSQVKSVLNRNNSGTGLGLAIVKKIIELHGSKIKVKSTLGKGSTFYFKLKADTVAFADEVSEMSPKNLINLKGKKVLIVEDTLINAALLIKILSKWEMESDHVENGLKALKKVKKKKFDFILMDIHLPEMNGFEVTRLIKTTINLNNNTPILALTADTMLTAQNYEVNYFNGFLWKPFEIDRLRETLGNISL
ncbi:ATP-binding protein [Flavobacterium sediminilitoris]|uniref:histidine kinase n=1 Tax=Flavobacterium sediminilitoris TaxID=2024526 RepID=A0ABY4HM86_9FLAO|nr:MULTISPECIES: ATP-binding protein [Flavobacterium]UOX33974.1 ATP-binding protein [Flavobacterium sediminilitoris]